MESFSNILVKTILAICFAVTTSCIVPNGQNGTQDVGSKEEPRKNNNIKYFDEPVSFESADSKAFEVFQVISDEGDVALASELIFNDKVVVLLGTSFYDKQIVRVSHPMQVGIYRYETKVGDIKTVPIIDTQLEEDK